LHRSSRAKHSAKESDSSSSLCHSCVTMNSPKSNPESQKRSGKSKRRKRRKTPSKETREKEAAKSLEEQQDSNETRPTKRLKRKREPLKGMVIAVSTLDVKGQSHTDSQSSYKAVAELVKDLGASVTGQLHRKVSCLVCNRTAVNNATQRVRKAVKKKVPLVDVEWIRQCRDQEELVAMDPHKLDDLACGLIASRAAQGSEGATVTDVTVVEATELPASAWSEPASLGCCCVCHENGDDNCPWCTDPDCNAKR